MIPTSSVMKIRWILKVCGLLQEGILISRIAEVQSTRQEEVLFGPVGLGLEDLFLTRRHISDSGPSNSSYFNMENEAARHNHPRGPRTLFLWRKGLRKEVRTSSFLIGDLVHWIALVHWTSHEQQPSSNFSFSLSFYCSCFLSGVVICGRNWIAMGLYSPHFKK
ncbi:hypothetical protein NC653_006293 [Populus alba x Populus x berolinensis]|uniref:Uncharacterized protein n=1 Tax=Populus alba x Populus x berolinensis TaxID=444605 RepID=A0AAD6RFD3_9ROSI|nr:hypothetical protein NC653_006293 [Populus alba x Populus x berolinensis]